MGEAEEGTSLLLAGAERGYSISLYMRDIYKGLSMCSLRHRISLGKGGVGALPHHPLPFSESLPVNTVALMRSGVCEICH